MTSSADRPGSGSVGWRSVVARVAAERLPWLLTLGAVLGAGIGAGVAVWRDADGVVSFTDVPVHVGEITREDSGGSGTSPAVEAPATLPAALTSPEPTATLPSATAGAAQEAATTEQAGAGGSPCASPCIAVVMVGLGQLADATEAAIGLPAGVTLSFSPYADDLPGSLARAREDGHEVLLGLPLQPLRFPHDDAGPLMLRPGLPADEQKAAVRRILEPAGPLGGVTLEAGAFAGNAGAVAPIVGALGEAALPLVELSGRHLEAAAEDAGVPYLSAMGPIDTAPAAPAIELALGGVEAEALRHGMAVAFARPMPVSIEQLAVWTETLQDKGLALVPLAILLAKAAEEPESRVQGQAHQPNEAPAP